VGPLTDDRSSKVLGSLPSSRPHRRSQKRAARAAGGDGQPVAAKAAATPVASRAKPTRAKAAAAKPAAKRLTTATTAPKRASTETSAAKRRAATRTRREPLRQPAQPQGTPPPPPASRRSPATSGADILGTAVQAAAELAEIGLAVSARAIRGAVSRLPRP